MTQKELSYVEDAIGHECTIIKVLEDSINSAEDENIISFLKSNLNNHMSIKENLVNLLEVKSNE